MLVTKFAWLFQTGSRFKTILVMYTSVTGIKVRYPENLKQNCLDNTFTSIPRTVHIF